MVQAPLAEFHSAAAAGSAAGAAAIASDTIGTLLWYGNRIKPTQQPKYLLAVSSRWLGAT